MLELLVDYHDTEAERVGIVLEDATVVELTNIVEDPSIAFHVDVEELLPHLDEIYAFWHTHSDCDVSPSYEDEEFMKQWPDVLHCIIGAFGNAAVYRVSNRRIKLVERLHGSCHR